MSDRTPTQLTATACPCCGYLLDAATPASDGMPAPKRGDFSVCLGCAAVLVFDRDIRPIKPNPGVLKRAEARQPELMVSLRRAQQAVRYIIASRRTVH